MPVSLANLGTAAETILNTFVTQLTQMGVVLPERRFVAPSPNPPWDGEQFSVAFAGLVSSPSTPPERMIGRTQTQQVAFSVSIVRIVHGLDTSLPVQSAVPSAGEMTADGMVVMDDASALWQAAAILKGLHSLARGNETYDIGPMMPVGPDGQLAATRLLLTFSAG